MNINTKYRPSDFNKVNGHLNPYCGLLGNEDLEVVLAELMSKSQIIGFFRRTWVDPESADILVKRDLIEGKFKRGYNFTETGLAKIANYSKLSK